MSVDTVLKDTKPKMEAVIEDLKRKLGNVRTGRATVGFLDAVVVDYYGSPTPLSQMASVAVPEPQLITLAGGEAITTGSATDFSISIEKLITADPEVILLGDAAYGVTADAVATRPGGTYTASRTPTR